MSSLERDSIEIGGDDRRIYFDRATERMGLSVSTVTDIRDNPEKKAALRGWRNAYDGSDSDSFPHHVEQMVYKQLRGTLGHYAILSNLGDVPKGDEEIEAEYILKNWDEERPSAQRDDVNHQGDDHSIYGEQAWSKCMRDLSWVTSEFYDVADEEGINPETTIATEDYVSFDDPLYRGQFDLLYEPPNGPVTLCDLKLSSGIRYDYKLQIAAYRNAILHTDGYPDEYDEGTTSQNPLHEVDEIPRVQIIRLHPDSEVVEIQTNDDWDTSIEELTAEFLALVERASEEWLTDITWEQFITSVDEDIPLTEIDSNGNY